MSKRGSILFIIFISGFFLVMMFIDVMTKDRIFSSNENRMLATRPEFIFSDVMDKTSMSNYETYITDQFAGRDEWVMLKTATELVLQKKDINGVYIAEDNYLIEQHTTKDVLKHHPKQKSEKLIAILDKYGQILGTDRVKAMLIPTADNVLTDKLPLFAEYFDQTEYIADLALSTNQLIQVTDTLAAHQSEYIYYKTDHHWTTLGAYYAYVEWAEAMGFTAWDKEDFSVETVADDFYGTIYSKLNIAKEADTIQLFYPKRETSYEVYYDKSKEFHKSLYKMEHLTTKNKYAVFLDDNHPFIQIQTQNENGRNLLVIKDSYANCFVPFVVNHYENVYMIDLRYYMGNIEDVVTEHGITDMLVLYDVIHLIENM